MEAMLEVKENALKELDVYLDQQTSQLYDKKDQILQNLKNSSYPTTDEVLKGIQFNQQETLDQIINKLKELQIYSQQDLLNEIDPDIKKYAEKYLDLKQLPAQDIANLKLPPLNKLDDVDKKKYMSKVSLTLMVQNAINILVMKIVNGNSCGAQIVAQQSPTHSLYIEHSHNIFNNHLVDADPNTNNQNTGGLQQQATDAVENQLKNWYYNTDFTQFLGTGCMSLTFQVLFFGVIIGVAYYYKDQYQDKYEEYTKQKPLNVSWMNILTVAKAHFLLWLACLANLQYFIYDLILLASLIMLIHSAYSYFASEHYKRSIAYVQIFGLIIICLIMFFLIRRRDYQSAMLNTTLDDQVSTTQSLQINERIHNSEENVRSFLNLRVNNNHLIIQSAIIQPIWEMIGAGVLSGVLGYFLIKEMNDKADDPNSNTDPNDIGGSAAGFDLSFFKGLFGPFLTCKDCFSAYDTELLALVEKVEVPEFQIPNIQIDVEPKVVQIQQTDKFKNLFYETSGNIHNRSKGNDGMFGWMLTQGLDNHRDKCATHSMACDHQQSGQLSVRQSQFQSNLPLQSNAGQYNRQPFQQFY